MKITVFNGSPRGAKSNTHIMVREFLAGAEEAGAQTENVFLAQKKIKHCLGCFACWIKTPGKCIIRDDMAELLEKSMASDIVVYACPIYVGDVTGIMKDFVDRTIPLEKPNFSKNKNGIVNHVHRYEKYPRVVLISNCGFPEQCHFKYFRNTFTYMEEIGGAEIIAEIYRGQGELLKTEVPQMKSILDTYKSHLRKAGREVVMNGKLSEETKAELEKPLIPYEMYLEQAEKHWEEMLSKID